MADQNDDLEQLLDSALDDFQSLNLTTSSSQRNVGGDGVSVKEGKKSVECGRPSLPSGVQGLVMGLPDLKVKKKLKQKLSKGGLEEAISSKGTPAEEAVAKLRMHTNEAIRGLESVTAAPKLDEDDWVKQFMEFSGGQDMESMVETMMQQLLSKEILHEPMKEIGEKYPKWLEDHKGSLSKEDYDRYSQQYKLITNLNDVYDNDPNNFTKIVDLMQKMQECGQPPHDIVQELGPDIDLANLAQLSPEMLDGQTNCCIM